MKNLIIQAIAASLYATYCTSIGGKFQDGEPLPGWEEFSSDPAKAKEAQGWIDIATKAAILGAIPVDLPDEVDVDFQIKRFKWLRKRLDGILLEIKPRTDQERRLSGRESSLAVTKIQEGIMWLGMALKSIGEKTGRVDDPYPSSKDPSNSTIEPTADGLTFGDTGKPLVTVVLRQNGSGCCQHSYTQAIDAGLQPGVTYVLDQARIGRSSSSFSIEGLAGSFNSVVFEGVDIPTLLKIGPPLVVETYVSLESLSPDEEGDLDEPLGGRDDSANGEECESCQ